MKAGFVVTMALVSGLMLTACSDERNETEPEPLDRGIRNQEMTDQGEERDIIAPATDTDPRTDREAEPAEDGNDAAEQDSYLPGAEDPEEMRRLEPEEAQ